jgi:hypothetical protein
MQKLPCCKYHNLVRFGLAQRTTQDTTRAHPAASLRGYPGIFSRNLRYLKASDSLVGFGFKSLSIR